MKRDEVETPRMMSDGANDFRLVCHPRHSTLLVDLLTLVAIAVSLANLGESGKYGTGSERCVTFNYPAAKLCPAAKIV